MHPVTEGRKIRRDLLDGLPPTPVLCDADQRDLCRRYQESGGADTEARDRFVAANLGLVYSLAGKLARQGGSLPADDLVSEGLIGLLNALRHFSLDRPGVRVSTYATTVIQRRLWRAQKRHRDGNLVQANEGEDGRFSLDATTATTEDEPSLLLEVIEETERARSLLSALHPRERQAVSMVHGLSPYDRRHDMAEIGRLWGVTKVRVRQIYLAARAHLELLIRRRSD